MQQLLLSLAFHSGQARDLPGAHREGHAPEPVCANIPDRQQLLGIPGGRRRSGSGGATSGPRP